MRVLRQALITPGDLGRSGAALALSALAVAGCSGARGPDDHGPLAPGPITRAVVSTTGDDAALGDDARPLRTLGRALAIPTVTTIVVRPGTYAEDLTIGRDVTVEAAERATLDGSLTVTAASVAITGLDLLRGARATGTPHLALSGLTVRSSSAADALALSGSVALLREVTLVCGVETCLAASGSTVSADGLTLSRGPAEHRRGLRAETSSVTVRRLRAGGASNVDVQANLHSHLTLTDAELLDITGNALAVQGGSTLWAARVQIAGVGRVAVVLSASDVTLSGLTLGPLDPRATGVGIEGGTVRISDARWIRAGAVGMTVNDHRTRAADVRLERARLEHGKGTGLNLGQGKLTLADVTLIGDPSADGEDAISASGDTADLTIESATIDGAAGHAIGVYNNAGLRVVRAIIRRPRLGGVLIEETAGADLVVGGAEITDCARGSGVSVVNALGVQLTDVAVARCPEAGVLAGLGAELTVRRARLTDNRQYGVAAFGRSTISLGESQIRGSKWAAFASCGDGSSIADAGGNTLTGATTLCP